MRRIALSFYWFTTRGRLWSALGLLGAALVAGCAQPSGTASRNQATLAESTGTPGSAGEDKDAGIFQSAAGLYLAARQAEDTGDRMNAAKFMAEALKRDPGNVDLLRDTFQLMLSEGRIEEADALAKRLVGALPDNQLASILLALEDGKSGRWAEAAARAAKLPRVGLATIVAPLIEAWALQGDGKTDEALRALDQLTNVRGFAVLHDFHSALIDEMAGRVPAAEAAFKSALAAESNPSFRVVSTLAAFYARQGRTNEALALFAHFREANSETVRVELAAKALDAGTKPALHPASAAEGMAEAMFDVGAALRQEANGRLSLQFMRLSLLMQPDLTIARITLADMLEADRRDAEALELYRGIDPDSPLYFSARLRVAEVLREMNRLDEAVKELDGLAAKWPDRSEPLATAGDFLRSADRFTDAVKAYDKALARVKNVRTQDWSLFYARGVALERAGEWPRAEQDFLEALKLSPDQANVLNYLGYSWVDRGENLTRAKELIERAVQLKPDDGYIVDSLGWVLYREGEYQRAVTNLERAVELRPDDPVINDHLGDAYWRVGRLAEARFQWKRVLSLKPEPDLATQISAKLDHGLKAAPKPGEKNS
jgi:tetratricopeptide (TPR) repeat protein